MARLSKQLQEAKVLQNREAFQTAEMAPWMMAARGLDDSGDSDGSFLFLYFWDWGGGICCKGDLKDRFEAWFSLG